MSKTILKLAEAQRIAEAVVAELRPGCERIEVAGSVRRRKPEVGDLEVVCVPRVEAAGLFGAEERSLLLPILDRLCEERRLVFLQGGEKARKYAFVKQDGLCLDLFIVRPETWGVQLAIRTGPAAFSQALVTRRCHGGLLPDDCKVHDGRVWRRVPPDGPPDGASREWIQVDGESFAHVPTPEERDVLELCGGWREPWDRITAPLGVGAIAGPAGGAPGPRASGGDPATSHQAARRAQETGMALGHADRIVAVLRDAGRGLTAGEIAKAGGFRDHVQVDRRRHEMVKAGLIVPGAEARACSVMGTRQLVWRLAGEAQAMGGAA